MRLLFHLSFSERQEYTAKNGLKKLFRNAVSALVIAAVSGFSLADEFYDELAYLDQLDNNSDLSLILTETEDARDFALSAGHHFVSGPQIQLSVSKRSILDNTQNIEDQNIRSYNLALATDPYNAWQLQVGYSYWGDADFFDIESISGGFYYGTRLWSSQVKYFKRDITAQLLNQTHDNTSRTAESTGIEYRVGLYPFSALAIHFSYDDYQYDFDPNQFNVFNRPALLNLFSINTLSLAQSLNKRNFAIELSYDFGRIISTVSWSIAKSAIDGTDLFTLALYSEISLHERFDLLAEMGLQQAESDLESQYISLGARFRW